MYLGKLGKRIIKHTVTNPQLKWLNRAVDAFGKFAHKATLGRYTPGLTREAFLLHQRTSAGDKISVEKDGFYRDGEKKAGNEYISKRIFCNELPAKFVRTEDDTPETIAKYCRLSFKPNLYLKTLKYSALYTLFFALSDIIFRVGVNLGISPSDSKYHCSGRLLSSDRELNWFHVPSDTVYDRIIGPLIGTRSPMCHPLPNGLSKKDFISITGEAQHKFNGDAYFLEIVNHHHLVNSAYAAFFFVGLSFIIYTYLNILSKLLSRVPKANLVFGCLIATGSLVQGSEIIFNGYGTDYLRLGNFVINLADAYLLIGGLGMSSWGVAELTWLGFQHKR